MSILVSGASGNLGRLVIDNLLARGVPESEIIAGARSPQRLRGLLDRGIRVVALDYDDPTTLRAGLEGVERFVLVSVSQPDTRLDQHEAVIQAAARAGVQALAYTSIFKADESSLPLAPIHRSAEKAIAASGVPAVILRNNAYTEMFLGSVGQAAQSGVLTTATGDGRLAAATRPDLAEAAAIAILDDSYLGRTLDLCGDTTFSYRDLARAASSLRGEEVLLQQLTPAQMKSRLASAGLDDRTATVISAMEAAIAAGDLESSDRTLSDMIGHPTTSIDDLLRGA